MTRLLTAAVLAPVLWVTIKLASVWVFVGVAIAVILAASWECYRMLRAGGHEPLVGLGIVATLGVLASFAVPGGAVTPGHVVVATVLGATAAVMSARESPRRMLDSLSATLLPVILIASTMGYVLWLRHAPGADGTDIVLLLFLCIICGDTAAYYVGSAFGRHRMAPTISPRKTWEGFAGAIVGSTVGALVAHAWFYQRLPLSHALALGVILGAAGALGDLAESVVKRACGVKDSSGVLPGHGGWFDRTDSLLFAAPILYHYHVTFLRALP